MVKSGAERSEKYRVKQDPDTIMLRWKALRDFCIEKFKLVSFRHEILDRVLQKLAEENALKYGQTGQFFDYARKLFYASPDMTELDFEIALLHWLGANLPEEKFNEVKDLVIPIFELFYICAYPTSKLFSIITIDPEPETQVFPIEEDYTEQVTEISEIETLDLLPERTEVSFLEVQVCAHNVVRVISALIPAPVIDIYALEINPSIHISVIYAMNPDFFPKIDIAIANPNLYNFSPTLDIGVVKTP